MIVVRWRPGIDCPEWLAQKRVLQAVASLGLGGLGVEYFVGEAVGIAVVEGITGAIAAGYFNKDACDFTPAFAPAMCGSFAVPVYDHPAKTDSLTEPDATVKKIGSLASIRPSQIRDRCPLYALEGVPFIDVQGAPAQLEALLENVGGLATYVVPRPSLVLIPVDVLMQRTPSVSFRRCRH